jgi:hypothetical protein
MLSLGFEVLPRGIEAFSGHQKWLSGVERTLQRPEKSRKIMNNPSSLVKE